MTRAASHGEAGVALLYRAYAKVNLTLEILGQREDGYHEIASLAQTISLADELLFESTARLTCQVEGMPLRDEENLVLQAARVLRDRCDRDPDPGARIRLRKAIPAAAGLGGGSSDAAASLVALNRLWGTGLSTAELAGLAGDLGSDVAFFLVGGTAIMRGRGERIEPLRGPRPVWIVLLVPPHDVKEKTRTLYRSLRRCDVSTGAATAAAAARMEGGRAIADDDLVNAFAHVARSFFPGLERLWHGAEALTGRRFHLSGSGPSIFALAEGPSDARAIASRARSLDRPVVVAHSVPKGQRCLRISYA